MNRLEALAIRHDKIGHEQVDALEDARGFCAVGGVPNDKAVLFQDTPDEFADVLIIVHDKEPADPSIESSDPSRPVRAIENDHTPGLAGARNAGLAVASGTFIASLDDDDYWIDGKVRAQVDALLAEPDLLVTATGVVLHTADGREWQRPPAGPLVTHEQLLRGRVADVLSSNLLMRRTAFDRVGPYDEELVGVEDWEWLLRVSRAPQPGTRRTGP